MRVAIVFSLACLLSFAAAAEDLRTQAKRYFGIIPESPPAQSGLTPEKVELGRMLYLDRRISQSQAISCNSCHDLGLAGADLQKTSIGHGWKFGTRNAPTTFNAVFHAEQFWDGRAHDLAEQAAGPIANPIEMASTQKASVDTLRHIPGYQALFKAVYPNSEEPVTLENVTDAIAAFESTLITPKSAFDQWLQGDDSALNETERAGLKLFIDKGCNACHSGKLFGGTDYRKFGQVSLPPENILPREDTGRMRVTGKEADKYVFKVPSLRNVALTRPYFHSGEVWSLSEAVKVMGKHQLGVELSDEEAETITAFLATLTGEQPERTYPALPPSVADTPRPAPTAGLESAKPAAEH